MPKPATPAKSKGSERPEGGESIAEVIAAGDRRRSLEAIRDSLARGMDEASPSVKAQLAHQLRATLKELADLPDAGVVTKVDELTARRSARRATAQAVPATGSEGRK